MPIPDVERLTSIDPLRLSPIRLEPFALPEVPKPAVAARSMVTRPGRLIEAVCIATVEAARQVPAEFWS